MADAAAPPETLGFRQFADRIGKKPGYVTQLRQAGRLVLTDDGKSVRVRESIALIADTMDPAKSGVVARHAAARAAAGQGGATAPANPPPADSGAEAGDEATSTFIPDDPHSKRRAKAMADKEEALARKALRDEQVELGNLLQRDAVVPVLASAVVAFRTSLENLSATLAPQLAALSDEARVKVLLDTSLEHTLDELSRQFSAIGREG